VHALKQPEPPSYRIRSSAAGSSKRGGDFATVVEITPHRQAFIVGDVAGNGAAAGDGAAALSAYVRYLVALHVPLPVTLQAASTFFARRVMNDAMAFASLFVAITDPRERTIAFASAGHEPALLFDGGDASVHVHLERTGPLLGIERDPAYAECAIPLFPESLLVVVTDGITDARRRIAGNLSFFGTSGVARAVSDAVRSRRDPANEIYAAAILHAGGALSDDACVMVSPLTFATKLRSI
jgi:sigma-B regulation protein RsbU (phosphoserine phosphatase)